MQAVVDFLNVFNTEASRISVTLSLFLIFLGLLYWYSVYPFSVLSRCGINHPKPVPFFGNLVMFQQGYSKPLNDLVKTHGKVCGYYLGRTPVVVVADPDMLRQVMVKDFSSFPNKKTHAFAKKPMIDCLPHLKNDRWKRVRSVLNPSFSAAKMKEMVPLINTATDALMNNLNAHAESGEAFDIHRYFGCFTIDVIASVAFGTQLDSQNNPDDPFVQHAQMALTLSFFRPIFFIYFAFPFLIAPLLRLIPNKTQIKMRNFFINSIQKIIKQREEQPPEQRRRDFLQLMLDARTTHESVSLEHFDTSNDGDEIDRGNQQNQPLGSVQENHYSQSQAPSVRRPQKKMMTEDEIVAQALVFLLAGYDTSSSTLAFTCYLLAFHPECQLKVQAEVDDFYTRYESPDYLNVQELKYLDMVICEALRLYPPGFRIQREIEHDCVVNGQQLPKGAILEIPAGFLHRDPEHWPEPEKFSPERFTPEAKASRHPFTYLPFGAGPRNCVGMRFAQLEIKMALVRLFHSFSILACPETKESASHSGDRKQSFSSMQAAGEFLNVFNIECSRISVTLSLFLIFLGLLYWYSVYPFSVLSRYGIKHPKPIPFFGNLFMFQQGFFKPLNDLIKTHGRLCGYYLGRRPVVVIADPDMLRQVMVKDFSSFPNRMAFRFATKPMTDCLLMLRNERWKRVRSILTPSFSAAKLKEMAPLINTGIDALMKNLNVHAESREAFDIHRCFGCFTMDVIASVAFATHVDSQNNPDDPFVHHAQMFFTFSFFRPILLFFMAFPFIMASLARFIPNKRRDKMNHFFINTIQKIIKQREEQPPEERRRDFLQLMLDARTTKESVSLEHFDTSNNDDEIGHRNQHTQPSGSVQESGPRPQEPSVRRPQKKMMTEDEIVGQAFVFLLAGYETSSNTLAFTCYLLALHPECQLKVQEEVDDFYTRYESPDYLNVQDLKYLDMVICEALRLYPPGFRFAREVDHDCVVNGQFLPKGITLEIPAGFLHYDPEYWPEPEKFIPERFTPEAKASRHPFTYLPFGAGPRNCVGMRLAQLEIKMALVRLFHSFSIVACSETKVPLELKSSSTLGPKNGVFVKITRRDQGGGLPNSPSD